MSHSIITYLVDQPFMMVLRGLLLSSTPRHLRDLSAQYSISPAGVSDILRRLKNQGVLKELRVKNKKCYLLDLPEDEKACLRELFLISQKTQIEQRAIRFSRGALAKFTWMDQARDYSRQVKRKKSGISRR